MRWIYISPHLDDAVLSCGGLIWEQTQADTPVEIWTLFGGFPQPDSSSDLIRQLHREWGVKTSEQAIALRRQEDQRAAQIVGARPAHFDFLDCIYRRSQAGQALYTDIFVPPHPAEADLPQEIATVLAGRLAPDDVVICPLALGGHVDHIIVRQAVERLKRPLHYYADIPYLLRNTFELKQAVKGMWVQVFPLSAQGLRAWQKGIAAYASQIKVLFGDLAQMRQEIRAYGEQTKGIHLWLFANQRP
jgi:LmbE family N-acetylglucosaminyl deacetylase